MAAQPSHLQGVTQDGDSLRDGVEFQPEDEDDDVEDAFLLSEIADLIEKVEEQHQSLTNTFASLFQELETERAKTEALRKEIEELDQLQREICDTDSLKPIQDQLEELSAEWEVIMKERKALESGNNLQGDLGMVAVYVEQAICAYVLPEVFLNNYGASLHDLLNYLNGSDRRFPLDPNKYDCEGILSEARNKWEIICKNFNFPDAWKTKAGGWAVYDSDVPDDIRAIEGLRMGGVCINYPCPISLKYAEENVESMKDELPPAQFKLVAEFIGSLREKITKTGLHHKNLRLD